ncbi:MAG TPA: phosphoribosylformylglycinamidine cyclo-ligase, partial [Gammaproteobacteria bacterium]|nr:phosphoribosylformylglycinamidine cyclo-ligase [Gammaproteobacteria bacterium]
DRFEMYRTLNCGVGMVICVPDAECDAALALLEDLGENAWRLGRVDSGKGEARVELND